MKSISFDAGPVISLAMNNLLWTLKELKSHFEGEFYISESVKKELVDKPLETKKFKFEALQILEVINEGILKVIPEEETKSLTDRLLMSANNIFIAKDQPITIVQRGEMDSLSLAIKFNSSALVVDERTTRKLLEDPFALERILSKKLHINISTKKDALKEFSKLSGKIKVIRSFELAIVAYKLGLFKEYIPNKSDGEKTLLEAVLWALKLGGCAVSEDELNAVIKSEA